MKDHLIFKSFILVLVIYSLMSFHLETAFCCPILNSLVDYNNDGKIKVVVIGDSIVRGSKDSKINKTTGGYVLRLARKFKKAEFVNLGDPGIDSYRLYSKFARASRDGSQLIINLLDADFVMIEIGTNDFWANRAPRKVAINIERLRNLINHYVLAYNQQVNQTNYTPYIFITTLPPIARNFQIGYVKNLNIYLLSATIKRKLNLKVRFDTLPLSILSSDGVHPYDKGYDVMGTVVSKALTGVIRKDALSLCKIRDSN